MGSLPPRCRRRCRLLSIPGPGCTLPPGSTVNHPAPPGGRCAARDHSDPSAQTRRHLVAKVPPTVTSTGLKRLQPQTTHITVLPDYKTGEGKLRYFEFTLLLQGHLNAYGDETSLLQAVANLPHKGGRTLTDMALNCIRQQSFKTQAGMRPRA
ncbi:Collagen alpha-1 chain [Camelus dromedarius]|uniref:Collagen alpha-1 chain n=1 Tax=Camelus dromedarius TaxID=9838 RepID=A0A5N4E3F1_CAMDR|nr:Collagen alpha-1 chain [Camelus dromedarius]